MVLMWFLLALVLLVVAVVLLRLDAAQKRRPRREVQAPDASDGNGASTKSAGQGTAPAAEAPGPGAEETTPGESAHADVTPRPAPFQAAHVPDQVAVPVREPEPVRDVETDRAPAPDPAESGAAGAGAGAPETDEAHPSPAAPKPGLLSRVRGMLPAAAAGGVAAGAAGAAAKGRKKNDDDEVVRSLEGSRALAWLEAREFAPTAETAPDLRAGEFALGLAPLGVVSTGVFRGETVLFGVSGDRAVLSMRRFVASDSVVDLRRDDVDAVPGLTAIGRVGDREAATDGEAGARLVHDERTVRAAVALPGNVRRAWLEGEWAVAIVDGRDDVGTWDDAVVALHELSVASAVLPPAGGVAGPIPAVTDPGAPGAAAGPSASPARGMTAAAPGTARRPLTAPSSVGAPGDGTPATAQTTRIPKIDADMPDPALAPVQPVTAERETVERETVVPQDDAHDAGTAGHPGPVAAGAAAGAASAGLGALGSRRGGHLRAVPERPEGVRDLGEEPVVADRGDHEEAAEETAASAAPEPEHTVVPQPDAEPGHTVEPEPEPSPFDAVLTPTGPIPSRGDVAADFLEPHPPLPRPTRTDPAAYGSTVTGTGTDDGPSIAVLGEPSDGGAATGRPTPDGVPASVEVTGDDVRGGLSDGGADGGTATGRHGRPAAGGADVDLVSTDAPAEEVPVWIREASAQEAPRAGGGRHRRPEPEEAEEPKHAAGADETGSEEPGRAAGAETPGLEPDLEPTTRFPALGETGRGAHRSDDDETGRDDRAGR